jgi:hypothetical protein
MDMQGMYKINIFLKYFSIPIKEQPTVKWAIRKVKLVNCGKWEEQTISNSAELKPRPNKPWRYVRDNDEDKRIKTDEDANHRMLSDAGSSNDECFNRTMCNEYD